MVLVGVLEMNLLPVTRSAPLESAPVLSSPEVAAEGFDDLGALWPQGGSTRSTFRSISGTWSARPRPARLALSLAAQAAPATPAS